MRVCGHCWAWVRSLSIRRGECLLSKETHVNTVRFGRDAGGCAFYDDALIWWGSEWHR
jgi:hypothetical protein